MLLICLCLVATSFSSEQSQDQADAGITTLDVSFRTRAGDKFDGRQLGEVELQNLSTHEWKVEQVGPTDGFYDGALKPGFY